jgi:hypothetical protein
VSAQPKVAMCETCPAWLTNGSAEGTCKRMPNGPHTLGTNYCMQHPANRHLMEPPAKCDEREEPEVTTVKVAYGPQDGGYCSDGSTPKPHCTVAAFVGKHVYDAVVAERDALKEELEAVRKDRAGLNGRLKAMMIQRMRWMNALGDLERMRQSFIVPELDQIEEEEQ